MPEYDRKPGIELNLNYHFSYYFIQVGGCEVRQTFDVFQADRLEVEELLNPPIVNKAISRSLEDKDWLQICSESY
jgi:hypothetical protein